MSESIIYGHDEETNAIRRQAHEIAQEAISEMGVEEKLEEKDDNELIEEDCFAADKNERSMIA